MTAKRACEETVVILLGYIIVLFASVGTYAMHGDLYVLWVPAEYLAIVGLMIGGFIASNDGKTARAILGDVKRAFGKPVYGRDFYAELFGLLYTLLVKIKRDGVISIEADVDKPESSPIFNRFEKVLKDHHVNDFIRDYFRMMATGNLNAFEIEALMDAEIDTHHRESHSKAHAVAKLAEALPAFGIVVAVMGVVNVMSSVGEPPEILGQMIGGALVGTFLGILVSYGFVQPIANKMEVRADEGSKPLECVKTALIATMNGYSPQVAIEFGRKTLFSNERPSFNELDELVRKTKNANKTN